MLVADDRAFRRCPCLGNKLNRARTSSDVLGTYLELPLLAQRSARSLFPPYRTFSHFPCSPRHDTLLFLLPPPLPPSYFIQAHHRSLTAGYRCFHHSPKGPRLPLPRSYLAPFLLFPAYPSRVRVPSPRLIISALIGSEEFHIG